MNLSKEIWEWIRAIAVAVVLALLIRFFILQVFVVEGSSMHPTLESYDRLVVDKISYRFHEPDHGDIVVFDSRTGKDFVKRVIGVGGDSIEIRAGQVYRNGDLLEEPYLMGQTDYQDYGPIEIPPDHFFLMGDFRRNSMDSRDERIGLVSMERIRGRACLVVWPPGEAKLLGSKAAAN